MTAPHPFAGITQIRSWGRPSLRDLSAWLIQAPPGSIEFGAVLSAWLIQAHGPPGLLSLGQSMRTRGTCQANGIPSHDSLCQVGVQFEVFRGMGPCGQRRNRRSGRGHRRKDASSLARRSCGQVRNPHGERVGVGKSVLESLTCRSSMSRRGVVWKSWPRVLLAWVFAWLHKRPQ